MEELEKLEFFVNESFFKYFQFFQCILEEFNSFVSIMDSYFSEVVFKLLVFSFGMYRFSLLVLSFEIQIISFQF